MQSIYPMKDMVALHENQRKDWTAGMSWSVVTSTPKLLRSSSKKLFARILFLHVQSQL